MSWLKQLWLWVRFGTITSKIVGTAGDNVPAEIEYYDRFGRVIGYWAYGYFDPNGDYRG